MMKNVYSVGQVNTYIKNMFAQDFMMQRISVKLQVSFLRAYLFHFEGSGWDDQCDHVCRKPPGALFPDERG